MAAQTQAFERSQKAMDFPVWQLSRNAKMLNWIWRNTELYMEAECWNGSASFCIVKGNEGRSEKLLKDPQKWWIFPSTSCLDFLWTLRQCKPKWIQKYLSCSPNPTTNSEVGFLLLELNVESSEQDSYLKIDNIYVLWSIPGNDKSYKKPVPIMIRYMYMIT